MVKDKNLLVLKPALYTHLTSQPMDMKTIFHSPYSTFATKMIRIREVKRDVLHSHIRSQSRYLIQHQHQCSRIRFTPKYLSLSLTSWSCFQEIKSRQDLQLNIQSKTLLEICLKFTVQKCLLLSKKDIKLLCKVEILWSFHVTIEKLPTLSNAKNSSSIVSSLIK